MSIWTILRKPIKQQYYSCCPCSCCESKFWVGVTYLGYRPEMRTGKTRRLLRRVATNGHGPVTDEAHECLLRLLEAILARTKLGSTGTRALKCERRAARFCDPMLSALRKQWVWRRI